MQVLPDTEKLDIEKSIDITEISQSIDSLPANKSPGSDGIILEL